MAVVVTIALEKSATALQANNSIPGTQIAPTITALQYGGFMGAWTNGAGQMFARKFLTTGAVDGASAFVGTVGVAASTPHLVTLADGTVRLSWADPTGAMGATIDPAQLGQVFFAGTPVAGVAAGPVSFPIALPLAAGGYATVFQVDPPSSDTADLWIRSNQANPLTLDAGTGAQKDPSGALLSTGQYVVAYDASNPTAGAQQAQFVAVNRYTEQGQIIEQITFTGAKNPDVGALADGSWVAVFEKTDATNDSGVHLVIWRPGQGPNGAGGAAVAEVAVDTGTGDQVAPKVYVTALGIAVSYVSNGSAMLRLYDHKGVAYGPAMSIGPAGEVDVAVDVNGAIAVVRSSPETDGDGGSIRLDAWQATRISTGDGANDSAGAGDDADRVRDIMIGNGGDDSLKGGGGDDRLFGDDQSGAGTGADTLVGGAGNDELFGGGGDDVLNGDATDSVGNGNDLLNGGAGADLMRGGGGDDVYFVDNTADQIVEVGVGGGTDTVYTSITHTLAANVEKGFLTVAGHKLTGNTLNNALGGTSGADVIDGGAGMDLMEGGAGNDVYFVDNIQDFVKEAADGGVDEVYVSSLIYTMTANVERGYLQIANGYLMGNALDNMMGGTAFNDILDGKGGQDLMEGGLGDDIYFVDAVGDWTKEEADGGIDTVYASVDHVMQANIEYGFRQTAGTLYGNGLNNNLGGSFGDDILWGGAGHDLIEGASGDDVIYGGVGDDTMKGGMGNDTFVINDVFDVVIEGAGEGFDTIYSSLSYTVLTANVERGILLNKGVLIGNGLDNHLGGTQWTDVLNGGSGADLLEGALGDDTYFVDNNSDQIRELAGEGEDSVYSTASNYVMDGNVERGYLLGANLKLTGNALNNLMGGTQYNDTLDGGLGGDLLEGGLGDDTYYVDVWSDVVKEQADQGFDTVYANDAYVLNNFVEKAVLLNAGHLDGNEWNNELVGSNGDDRLSGGDGNDTLTGGLGEDILIGGVGADTMDGGFGDDTYFVDNVGDVAVEGNSGFDTVYVAGTHYIMGAGIERGILLTPGFVLNGNSMGNVLGGTTGNDWLNGMTGADWMEGWTGDDGYYVDNVGDKVVEAAGQGYDTVYAYIDYTLEANVERAYVMDFLGNLTGNELDNVLGGSTGSNILIGGGGRDFIEGGTSADVFRYLAVSDSNGTTGRDMLNDFEVGVDKIDVSALRSGASDTFHWEDRGNGLFFFNMDIGGDGTIDLSVRVKGSGFTAADVIWDAPANMPVPLSDEGAQDLGAAVFKPAPEDGVVEDVFVFTGPTIEEIEPEVFVGAPDETPVFDAAAQDLWIDTPVWTVGFDAQNGWITIDDGGAGRPERGWFWG